MFVLQDYVPTLQNEYGVKVSTVEHLLAALYMRELTML